MTPKQKDIILTFAILSAAWTGLFSGYVWWVDRQLAWTNRAWYAPFPPATALAALAIGALIGWLWSRSSSK